MPQGIFGKGECSAMMMTMWMVLAMKVFLTFSLSSRAEEACGRVARVGHQDILLDTGSTRKGEGLRYLLEKDPGAKIWLERYQKRAGIRWENALAGTLGTGLLLGGLTRGSEDQRKDTLLFAGVALIALNFLVAKSLDQANEANLLKAIEEYNKKNTPKIYFGVGVEERKPAHLRLALSRVWEF